jgi:hypothetical protein
MQSQPTSVFPWNNVIPDVCLALASSFVALFCTATLATYLGPQSCILIFNDHVIGGTQDQLTMMAFGTAFGAVAVFCVCRIRDRILEWRRARDVSYPRVVPR